MKKEKNLFFLLAISTFVGLLFPVWAAWEEGEYQKQTALARLAVLEEKLKGLEHSATSKQKIQNLNYADNNLAPILHLSNAQVKEIRHILQQTNRKPEIIPNNKEIVHKNILEDLKIRHSIYKVLTNQQKSSYNLYLKYSRINF